MMHLLFAQTEVNIQNEINQEVWKPFVAVYNAYDAVTYNALHTEDIVRVMPEKIIIGNAYKQYISEHFPRNKKEGVKHTIQLWFEHRKSLGKVAYEVGYYKVQVWKEKQRKKNFYGRFHVVLKKDGGKWKIAQDWDTSEINGRKITEEDFSKKIPMEF